MNSKPLYELQNRIIYLIIAMLVYRLGTHITIPGINGQEISRMFSGDGISFLNFLNMVSGSALSRASIFSLGIGPYISASIMMQFLIPVVPYFDRLRKEEGDLGRRVLNQYTRYLTVLIGALNSFLLCSVFFANNLFVSPSNYFYFSTIMSLLAGTMFLMWLGEQISEYGIGNGISMLIFASIVAGLPDAVVDMSNKLHDGSMSFVTFMMIMISISALIMTIVYMEKAQRKIPVYYSRGSNFSQAGGAGKQRSVLPFKLNMSGVLPAIFVMIVMQMPAGMLKSYFSTNSIVVEYIDRILDPLSMLYISLYFCLITLFCFFFNAMMNNPKDIADNLKKSGALIQGIRPGNNTAQYLDKVMSHLTLGGSVYITAVVLLPQIIASACSIPLYFAGTSLLISIVVVLDFITQVQSYMYSAAYGSLYR